MLGGETNIYGRLLEVIPNGGCRQPRLRYDVAGAKGAMDHSCAPRSRFRVSVALLLQKLQGLLRGEPGERLLWRVHLRGEDRDRESPIRRRKGFRGAGNSGRGRGACRALRDLQADPDRVRRGYKGDHGKHQGRRVRCNGNGAATSGVYWKIYG